MSEQLFDVSDLVELLDPELREWYDERAAIREYDGGLDRWLAESLAMLDLLRAYPDALTQMCLAQVEVDGKMDFLLTTDIDGARQRCSAHGLHLRRVVRPDLSLDEHFNGVAILKRLAC